MPLACRKWSRNGHPLYCPSHAGGERSHRAQAEDCKVGCVPVSSHYQPSRRLPTSTCGLEHYPNGTTSDHYPFHLLVFPNFTSYLSNFLILVSLIDSLTLKDTFSPIIDPRQSKEGINMAFRRDLLIFAFFGLVVPCASTKPSEAGSQGSR